MGKEKQAFKWLKHKVLQVRGENNPKAREAQGILKDILELERIFESI